MKIYRFKEVGSTQDTARELLKKEKPPFAVIAQIQLSGRGREGRTWYSPSGGFWATVVLEGVSKLQFRASLAIIDTCNLFGASPSIKWPNDIILFGKKLAGILVESEGKIKLLGVGVNVNNDPPLPSAISLKEVLGKEIKVEDFEENFFENLRERILEDEFRIIRDVRRLCETVGKNVEVITPNGRISGRAIGIGEEGELIVWSEGGEKKVFLGDVYHLRELRKINNCR